jgi:multiple sugar transport system ATP-binding protein
MNLIRTVVEHGHALLGDLRIEVGAKQLEALTGNRIVVGLHPEDLLIGASGGGIRATATLVRDIGREYQVHARTDIGDGTVDLVIRHIEGTPPDRGEALVLGAVADRARLFDADTGLRLPD